MIFGHNIRRKHLRKYPYRGKRRKIKLRTGRSLLLDHICYACDQEKSPESILAEVASMLTEMLPFFIWAGFYYADKRSRNLVLSARGGKEYGKEIIPFGDGPIGRIAVTHQVFLKETDTSDEYRKRHGVMYRAAVPVFVNGGLEGVIGVDSVKKDEFIEEEIHLIEDVGDIVADHIQMLANGSLDHG